MFIHPRSGIVASDGGCRALDGLIRYTTANASGPN
jgi:hypothetical protein